MSTSSVVSRPAWVKAMNALTGTGGVARKSPVEIFATAMSTVTRSPYAEVAGLGSGRLRHWTDGVAALRADRVSFAAFWREQNERVLRERAAGEWTGPLWVALGDSTAQGLGAAAPCGGYVGQVLGQLRRRSGQPWQVVNLSVSGSLIRDVLDGQLPGLAGYQPALVTCGAGFNDILFSSPGRLFRDLRALLAALPSRTILLDLPVPGGFLGLAGRASVPYITRINRVIHEEAANRALPVARVSGQFTAPWAGKFSSDNFHPSQDGYRDWARALVTALSQAGQLPVPACTTPIVSSVTAVDEHPVAWYGSSSATV